MWRADSAAEAPPAESGARAPPAGPPRAAASPPALLLEGVGKRFGAVVAVGSVSLRIESGERRAILGPNGAGKSTLFNIICGVVRASQGSILFFGEDITRLSAHRRARGGIGRTYQNSRLFDGLSVLENLFLAVRGGGPGRFSLLRPGRNDRHVADARRAAERVRLDNVIGTSAADLSHGQRRQLEVGMALASEPRVLMLDEPAAGLSAGDRPELLRLLRELPRALTLVLIEHDMDIALPIADRVLVMVDGNAAVEDTPDRIAIDPTVRAIYLG